MKRRRIFPVTALGVAMALGLSAGSAFARTKWDLAAAYPAATWERLRQVKRKYDPDNLFHRNQNVPPAA